MARNNGDNDAGIRGTLPEDLMAPYSPRTANAVPTGLLPQQIAVYDPFLCRIPGSLDFTATASASTSAAGSGDMGLTVTLPSGNVGVLEGVTFYVNNMLASTVVSFSLQINRAPIPGYGGVSIFPRAAPSVSNGYTTNYRLPAGGIITCSFTNTDGGTYVLGVLVSGWFFPDALGKLWLARGFGGA